MRRHQHFRHVFERPPRRAALECAVFEMMNQLVAQKILGDGLQLRRFKGVFQQKDLFCVDVLRLRVEFGVQKIGERLLRRCPLVIGHAGQFRHRDKRAITGLAPKFVERDFVDHGVFQAEFGKLPYLRRRKIIQHGKDFRAFHAPGLKAEIFRRAVRDLFARDVADVRL